MISNILQNIENGRGVTDSSNKVYKIGSKRATIILSSLSFLYSIVNLALESGNPRFESFSKTAHSDILKYF